MVDVALAPAPARAPASTSSPSPGGSRRRRRIHAPTPAGVVAFALVMLITLALALTVHVVNDSNEQRLLRLQTRQTALLIESALDTIETPLASAVEIAAASGGNSTSFRRFVVDFLKARNRFVSLSLWRVQAGGATRVTTVGQAPRILADPARAAAFMVRSAASDTVSVVGRIDPQQPRLGYAYASSVGAEQFVVYAESALLPSHRTAVAKDSPFADTRFALYLGTRRSRDTLIATSESRLPIRGRTASQVIPFGSARLTLVEAPVGPLGGRYGDDRWWIVTLLGGLVALGSGIGTDRLVRRRRRAETLAGEIDVLLQDQRSISDSLQRALLPGGMPDVPGLEIASRYLAGEHGIEIGGDWFDVIPVDDDHVFFTVGDVSGRGLGAGSVMASLHFAIRAYVREGHGPTAVLDRLTNVLDLRRDKHFATVLCGLVDVRRRELTLANAGHLPPLVIDGTDAHFVDTDLGPPIGVSATARYRSVTVGLPVGSTLLAYTDGLVERRGETLDDGLARLGACASRSAGPLDGMLTDIVGELIAAGSEDDTALLGLRWTEKP